MLRIQCIAPVCKNAPAATGLAAVKLSEQKTRRQSKADVAPFVCVTDL